MWKDINGFDGKYQISDSGQIRNSKGKILKGYINNKGYQMVHLRAKGIDKLVSIHTLVATHYIPNPLNLPQVNHKDEVKVNNNASNLEWCTSEYNVNYGTRNKRVSKTKTNNTYNTKQVVCIETGIVYPSTREAERQTGIDNSQISAVCKHKKNYKTAGGYHWEYIERSDK